MKMKRREEEMSSSDCGGSMVFRGDENGDEEREK